MKGRNNKMKKSHLLILAGVLVLLVTMCIGISAEDTVVAKIGTTEYTSLAQAINAAKDGDTIIVTADTTLSETLEVKNKNITIKSESADDIKTITYVSNYITVTADEGKTGSLTLEKITVTKQADSDKGTYAFLHPIKNGTAILNSGATIKNSSSSHAGAIFCEGGDAIMNDGAVLDGCSNQWRSGAVHVEAGSFTMNGGIITNCVGNNNGGSALGLKAGTMTLNGGSITNNTGSVAVKVLATATSFSFTDQLVMSGNTANMEINTESVNVDVTTSLQNALDLIPSNYTGATINIKNDLNVTSTLTFNKTAVIEGNNNKIDVTANAWFHVTAGDVTFKNITVTRNIDGDYAMFRHTGGNVTLDFGAVIDTVKGGNGGAVFFETGGVKTFTMNEGSAIKNAAARWESAPIYMNINTTFNMNGGEISGCSLASTTKPTAFYVMDGAVLNLNKGEIKNNGTSSNYGNGAVYVTGTGKVNVSADVVMTGNGGLNIYGIDAANIVVDEGNASCVTYDNLCYYDADVVAVADKTKTYFTLYDAIASQNGASITVLKDCAFEGSMPRASSYTLDGRNNTVTIKNVISIAGNSIVTWKNVNVNVDLDTGVENNTIAFRIWNTSKFILGEGAVVTSSAPENLQRFVEINSGTTFELDGGKITGIKKPQEGTAAPAVLVNGGGTFNMISGYITDNEAHTEGAIIIQQNGVMNMSGGEISGNKAQLGGAIGIYGGTLNMSGGKITGNSAWEGSAIRTGGSAATVLNFSGNAYVYGNNSKNPQVENIAQKGATITVKDFTGKLGINQRRESDKVLGVVVGTEFGTAEGTLPTVGTIVSDADDSIFACISGGKLIWTTKAGLAIETDAGKYTKTGDETVYGVIRILTKSNSDAAVPVESFGTAYVKNGADETSIDTRADYNFTKNETFENGKGYIVDVVDVDTGATYTYIPVSYYKIAGIDEMVYVTGTAFEFDVNAETVKDLGKDPADLNY